MKNLSEFTQPVREIDTQEMMISFDVVSLFTKVTVDDALQAIFTLLTQDGTLEEQTAIPVPHICALTELCLHSTYFMFDDTFFDQVEGATLGSPLSPIVANQLMEAFEERALKSAVLWPRMWVRYVDDTFVLWPHDEDKLVRDIPSISQFSTSINTIHNGEGK